MIANDCYRTGQFYYAAKAFDVLERLDPNPEYWEGKRGACIGWFQRVVADKEPKGTIYNNKIEIKEKFRFIDRPYFDVTKYEQPRGRFPDIDNQEMGTRKQCTH